MENLKVSISITFNFGYIKQKSKTQPPILGLMLFLKLLFDFIRKLNYDSTIAIHFYKFNSKQVF